MGEEMKHPSRALGQMAQFAGEFLSFLHVELDDGFNNELIHRGGDITLILILERKPWAPIERSATMSKSTIVAALEVGCEGEYIHDEAEWAILSRWLVGRRVHGIQCNYCVSQIHTISLFCNARCRLL